MLPVLFDEEALVLLHNASYQNGPLDLIVGVVNGVAKVSNVRGAG